MKLRTLPILALIPALLSGPLLAQKEKAEGPNPFKPEPLIRVQVEYVEVSHEQLTELMFGSEPTPTEYDPPEIPTSSLEKGQDPEADPTRLEAVGPNPTAFETRNLGPTLEVETKLDEASKIVDLKLVSEIVEHVGNSIWLEWKGKHGDYPVQMPTMYTVRFNTNLVLACGKPTLAAVLTPKGQDGKPDPSRKLLVFVKCDMIIPGQ